MQYHALALAVNAGDVDLVGLEGAPLHAALTAEPRLHSHRLSDAAFKSRSGGGRRRFVLMSAARAAVQASALLTTLLRLPKPDVILVQNPPAAPTLAVAWLAARMRGARLRDRLAQPLAHHPGRAAGRASSRRAFARQSRTAVGQTRGRALRRVQCARRLAPAAVGDRRHRALRSSHRLLFEAVARCRRRVVAAARARSQPGRPAAADRRVSDELDAGRGFRSAARSARTHRTHADRRTWKGRTRHQSWPCSSPDEGRCAQSSNGASRDAISSASRCERSGWSRPTIRCSSGWRTPASACISRRRASICR